MDGSCVVIVVVTAAAIVVALIAVIVGGQLSLVVALFLFMICPSVGFEQYAQGIGEPQPLR